MLNTINITQLSILQSYGLSLESHPQGGENTESLITLYCIEQGLKQNQNNQTTTITKICGSSSRRPRGRRIFISFPSSPIVQIAYSSSPAAWVSFLVVVNKQLKEGRAYFGSQFKGT